MAEWSMPGVLRWSPGRAAAAGVGLGAAYAASPLSVWFVIAMLGIFWWAGRGLTERERRFVLGILALAVVLRVLAIAALFLTSDHQQMVSFFWDGDGVYLKRRAAGIRNVWLGVPLSPVQFSNAFDRSYGWSTYLYFIAYVQYLTGPAPYAVHLLNITLFVAAAVALYRLVRSAYGPAPAVVGLTLLLFLPTLFLWSISALKESLYVFLCVVGLVATVTIARADRMLERVFALALLVGAVVANGTVRAGAFLIETAGIAVGVAGSLVVRRLSLILLVVLLVPFAAWRVSSSAGLQSRIMSRLRTSAVLHIGNVRTEGHAYKLLDERFYSVNYSNDAIMTMTPIEGLRFASRALVSFVLVPLPWQIQSPPEMAFLPQQIVWYALVALAFVGLVAGLRRDALVTCLLAGLAVTGAAVIALNSGNVGTMVRFRDTVVPFVIWLSALGAVVTIGAMMSRGEQQDITKRGQRACH